MPGNSFLDSNILVYAYDVKAGKKREIALDILERAWALLDSVVISVQVLQEFHVNLVKRGATRAEATRIVQDFRLWPIIENTTDLFYTACEEQSRWQVSLWDSLIIAAAKKSGAKEIITEDLNDGQNFGGIIVRNPFK